MVSITQATPASDVKGIFTIISSEILLALVNTIVKFVHNWSTQKVMIIRYSVDLCLCMGMWGLFHYEMPGRWVVSLCLLRGIAYIAFIVFLWAALRSCMPLGDIIVLVITFSQIFFILLARLLLGEKIPSLWPLQFALCVFGAILINKPLAPDRDCALVNAMLPLACGFCGGMMNLLSRNVKDVPSPIVCIYNDLVALLYASGTIRFVSDGNSSLPDRIDSSLLLVALTGVLGWAGLLLNVMGYQSVSVSAVASIAAYVAVPLGFIFQVAIFGQTPDILSVVGAAIIVFTNIAAIGVKYYAERRASAEDQTTQMLAADVRSNERELQHGTKFEN